MKANDMALNYFDWVKNNHQFQDVNNNTIEVQTPFLDNFGDNISLIVIKDGSNFKITDEGYTIWNLKSNGIDLMKNTTLRNQLMHSIIDFDSANLSTNNEIIKVSDEKNLSQSIHEMTQTLLRLSDLSFTHSSRIKTIFYQEVLEYFSENKSQYNYFPNFYITGKSQLKHKIDYLFFNKDRERKLVKVQNSLNKNSVDSVLISWLDTSSYRAVNYGENTTLDVIVSGENYSNVKEEFIQALNEYNIGVVNFDNKEELQSRFA
ncbi:DUF1828 domain-containing protein [Desemzia sp. C1]|uniref:DUF1828 domain-containing protein n=1 Tax=Desemzia TaxID=82800 RepID=UPI001660B2B1|nr:MULTISPECIES: DUF1828 domain-containing protein [Desemzia]MCI3029504.1 DUF1828 domain-containing protein [Desemzia sp. C1]